MPQPLPDLTRDQQCHYFKAPTGERCGSPAMRGAYYCFQHDLKRLLRSQSRILIDPEITRMEVPPIEDRASIFVALAAVIHRLAENTIDTRRAGQMIYGLQSCLQALPPAANPAPAARQPGAACSTQSPRVDHAVSPCAAGAPNLDPEMAKSPADSPLPAGYQYVPHPDPEPESELEPGFIPSGFAVNDYAPFRPCRHPPTQPATGNPQPPTPQTIPITKESLVYFLRSRHCAHCNAELFPASELTCRRNAGAPPEVIEEARHALPAPEPATGNLQPSSPPSTPSH